MYILGLINRRKISWLHGGSIPPTPIKYVPVVQWLTRGLAKAEMTVQFRSGAFICTGIRIAAIPLGLGPSIQQRFESSMPEITSLWCKQVAPKILVLVVWVRVLAEKKSSVNS